MGYAWLPYDYWGKYVMEMAARTDFLALNDGKKTTFRRFIYMETISDISMVFEELVSRIEEWMVSELDITLAATTNT